MVLTAICNNIRFDTKHNSKKNKIKIYRNGWIESKAVYKYAYQ